MPKKRPAPVAAQAGRSIMGSGFAVESAFGRGEGHGADEEDDYFAEGQFNPSASSTCWPETSRDDLRSFSEVLDKAMDVPFGTHGLGRSMARDSTGADWQAQSPDEIIREVKQFVQAQKPERVEYDDEIFEKRRAEERQDRMDRGFMVILPDNRVRSMDSYLSRRVRAQLLGEEEPPEGTSLPPVRPLRRKEEAKKSQAAKQARTPWYLPPTEWFSSKAAKDKRADAEGSFPYDSQILHGERHAMTSTKADDEPEAEDGPHRLTQREKETLQIVEAYKQHMKGSRLPHFLQ